MDHPAWYTPGDPALLRAMGTTWAFSRLASPRRFPHGVERFRSSDEMHRLQEAREGEYVRQLQAERASKD